MALPQLKSLWLPNKGYKRLAQYAMTQKKQLVTIKTSFVIASCLLLMSYQLCAQSKFTTGITNNTPKQESDLTPSDQNFQSAPKPSTIIWYEDFSNGFAGMGNNGVWTQTALPSSNGKKPEWEFRGPNTNPNTTVGSRGSCARAGTGAYPIESKTASNGFMIFDSNYWDEPAPDPCAGLGTGLAPQPHNASIISPKIDLSSFATVELTFTTYARNFQAELNLYAIADGDTIFITKVYDHIALAQNTATSIDRLVRIDISELVGSKSDVKLLWNFVGDYYFFSIDDIYLAEIPEYDYDIVEIWGDDISNSFEYNDLPLSQSHIITPGMRIKSGGSKPVDLELVINILDPNGVTHGPFNHTLNNITRDSISAPIFIPTFQPEEYGEYRIQYKVMSVYDALDIEPENNVTSRTFNISKNFWSDAFSDSVSFYPAPLINGQANEIEAFQLFETINADHITGIQFCIINSASYPDQSTLVNDTIQLSVYLVDKIAYRQSQQPPYELLKNKHFTLIDSVRTMVTEEMISTSDIIKNNYLFDAPVPLKEDQLYAISIYNVNGFLNLSLTVPSLNSDGSGLIRSDAINQDPNPVGNNEVHQYTNFNPWLKAIMYNENSVTSDSPSSLPLHVYPNPAGNMVTITYTLKSTANVALALTDLSGKVVATQNEGYKNAGVNKLTFDLSSLDAGVYFYSVSIDGATTTKKLLISK